MLKSSRENQRYDEQGSREVAVALIFADGKFITHRHVRADDTTLDLDNPPTRSTSDFDSLGIMFVSSRNHDHQVTLPKGGWEHGEDVVSAARREAMEEGGMICAHPPEFSSWTLRTVRKEGKKHGDHGLHLHVVPLVSRGWEKIFLEQHERKRFCVSVKDILQSKGTMLLTSMGNSEETTPSPLPWIIKREFVSILQDHLCNEEFAEMLLRYFQV